MSLQKQGDLDSLCGIYATINAIGCFISWNNDDRRDLFHHIVNHLGCGGLLRVIKDGTGRNVLSAVVLRSALEWVEVNKYCVIEAHKMRNQSKMSLQDIWNKLETFFEENDNICSVIFGYHHIHKPSHCTCIHGISKAQLYIKDGNIKRMYKSKFSLQEPTQEKPYSISPSWIWMVRLGK